MKIVFMGNNIFSSIILANLVKVANVVLVVVSSDANEVIKVARENNITVYKTSNIKLEYQTVLDYHPDLIITASFGQIIPKELLSVHCINIHASLLPLYRGASPIQYALLNGDKTTGITIMEMVYKMDAGNIIYQEKLTIDDDDNFSSLLVKLAYLGAKMLNDHIDDILSKNYTSIIQDNSLVTFSKKILSKDEHLSFNDQAFNVVNKIRALSLIPGAYITINNVVIKILKARVTTNPSLTPSRVVSIRKKFVISTLDYDIEILEVLQAGKKIMEASAFLNGQRFISINDLVE